MVRCPVISPDHLNALIETSHRPEPLVWSSWPERAGWLEANAGTAAYEIGKHIINADPSLTYMVDERRSVSRVWNEGRFILLVGPRGSR